MLKAWLGFRDSPPTRALSSVSPFDSQLSPRLSKTNLHKMHYAPITHWWIDPRSGLLAFVFNLKCSPHRIDPAHNNAIVTRGLSSEAIPTQTMDTILILRDVVIDSTLDAETRHQLHTFLKETIPPPTQSTLIQVVDEETGIQMKEGELHCVWRGDLFIEDTKEKKAEQKRLHAQWKRQEAQLRTLRAKTKKTKDDEKQLVEWEHACKTTKLQFMQKEYTTLSLRRVLLDRKWARLSDARMHQLHNPQLVEKHSKRNSLTEKA